MSTSAAVGSPISGPRRSSRMRGRRRQLQDGGAPSMAPSGAPPARAGRPSSLPRRIRRGASPGDRPSDAREMEYSEPLVVVLDDSEMKQTVQGEEQQEQGKEILDAEGTDQVGKDVDALKEAPFWLPDGWIINVRRGEDGSIHRYYTSPVSEYTFSTKMEALSYLFSEMDERVLDSRACTEDKKKMHTWLPDGWVIEVRAGGKTMDKMYKFYVHLPTGMRFFSKEDALRYVNEGVISRCNVEGLCDTSPEDNILSQVEFNPDGLPEGWVKEVTFRKYVDGIRKDAYYTDPVSHHVFRTLKSVMSYLETGEISRNAYIPRTHVTDMYSFDKCTNLPERMLKRVQGKSKRRSTEEFMVDKKLPDGQTSNHSEDGTSAGLTPLPEPKQEKFETGNGGDGETISSQAKPSAARPRKIAKQTEDKTPDSTMDSHKDTPHTVVENEVKIESQDQMLNENTPESAKMEKNAIVAQEVDDMTISTSRRDKPDVVSESRLHEQENVNSTGASAKSTSSSGHKFYTRRNSSLTLGLKKE